MPYSNFTKFIRLSPTDIPWEGFKVSTTSNTRVPKCVEAVMYIMYIAISVAAIGGNGIVCYIVLAYQRMRNITNFFIVNLAIGDILMACLCIPFGFVSNLLLQYWPFGTIMCIIVSYAQAVSVFVSAYTLIVISVDRYVAILYPLKPRMTKLQAKISIVMVWIVALLTPLPTAVVSRLAQPIQWLQFNITDRYVCMEEWETEDQRYYYSMALMVLQYFFPLIVLIYTYGRIAVAVWGKQTPGEAEDVRDQRLATSKRKIIKMMMAVVTVFTFCWLPLNTLIVTADQNDSVWEYDHIIYVWFVCHWLAMSHAAYNPLIYCWMNSRFRDGFQQFSGKFYCWKSPNTKISLDNCKTYTTSFSIRYWSRRFSSYRHGSSENKKSNSKTCANGTRHCVVVCKNIGVQRDSSNRQTKESHV